MLDLSILGVTMRMAAPILLAGTGTLYNDRAGVTNITLEGSMLLGGFLQLHAVILPAVGYWLLWLELVPESLSLLCFIS